MRSLRQLAVLAAVIGVGGGLAAVTGCGGSPAGKRAKPVGTRPSAARGQGSRTMAGSTQLHAGEHDVLLRIGNVGRFRANCDRAGRPSVTFTAAFLLPTASVTVNMGAKVIRRTLDPGNRLTPPAGTGFQIWQVAPFAKAGVRITTIWVSLGQSPARVKSVPCGVSAQALTTPQD
jgi:hypothetical protein